MGPNVTELQPGDHVVATVRRPGSSIYDRIDTYDMTWEIRRQDWRVLLDTLTRTSGAIKVYCVVSDM